MSQRKRFSKLPGGVRKGWGENLLSLKPKPNIASQKVVDKMEILALFKDYLSLNAFYINCEIITLNGT